VTTRTCRAATMYGIDAALLTSQRRELEALIKLTSRRPSHTISEIDPVLKFGAE
jgi:hypothetical protein